MDAPSLPHCLWSPSDPDSTATFRLRDVVNKQFGLSLKTYNDLYTWSVENVPEFWSLVWDETNVIGEKGSSVVDSGALPVDNPTWFPDARLNWAENMLRLQYSHKTALISTGERNSISPILI